MALYRGWTALFMRVAPLYIIYLPAYEQVRVRVFGLGGLDLGLIDKISPAFSTLHRSRRRQPGRRPRAPHTPHGVVFLAPTWAAC